MLARVYYMLYKELLQLRRDKGARLRLLIPPIVQVLLFGYAATFEVFHVSTAILDLDQSQESRDLTSSFTHSHRFQTVAIAASQRDVDRALLRGEATVGLSIGPGFAAQLRKGQAATMQVIVDGTNSNTALIGLGYVNQIADAFSQRYAAQVSGAGSTVQPLQIAFEPRQEFNEDLNSRWFFVPGLIGTLTLVSTVSLTAFAIVREREMGTLEQIMVTPMSSAEFIIGKTVPAFLIGLAEVALIAVVGTLWFRIPFVGNPLVMLLGTTLFLLSTLAIGLLISTVCVTQQQAFATNFFLVNPLFTLSGFSFPISSMPPVLQWFTYVDPLRYYLIVIRGTFLKGVGLAVLWPELCALALIAIALLTMSVWRFRKALD
jgi:ABC-2 type transport system permease protein